MIRTYDEAMWDARLSTTLRLRWAEWRARRQARAGTLDSDGQMRWAATIAELRDRNVFKR
ncbi:MAG TPA: hypothetical protein VK306_14430 [Acidimicrobiales bacterium]|nr:hypothetical protein [Acidimicrobiales bacterium]